MPDNSVMKEGQFNGLTPAEAERLFLLLEEMGEAQQVIGKILRHGYDSYHPHAINGNNRELLETELGDVRAAIKLMVRSGDVRETAIENRSIDKREKVKEYLHHNF